MDNVFDVAVIDPCKDLLHKVSSVLLCEIAIKLLIRDLFEEFSASQKLCDNVIILFVLEYFVKLDDVWMVHLSQNFRFIFQPISFGLFKSFLFNDLYRP